MSSNCLHYSRHRLHPYVVYGVIPRFRAINAFETETPDISKSISGSTALISAGLRTTELTIENESNIALNGIRYKYAKYVTCLIESLISALITPDMHVVVIWLKCHSTVPGPISGACHAGFKVEEIGDCVRCTGKGQELGKWRWFKDHIPNSLYIISSSESMHEFENTLVEYLNNQLQSINDPNAMLLEVLLGDQLKCVDTYGLDLIAGIGGPDLSHFYISKTNVDLTFLDSTISDVVTHMEIPLYSAALNEDQYGGGLFCERYWDYHPIPPQWTRIDGSA